MTECLPTAEHSPTRKPTEDDLHLLANESLVIRTLYENQGVTRYSFLPPLLREGVAANIIGQC
jgi:hypothetical protein